jgi:hypothetical protein
MPLREYLNPFSRRSYALLSPHSPDVCAERLDRLLVRWSYPKHLFVPPEGQLVGSVGRDGFEVRRHRRGRNSFAPFANGRFVSDGARTRIDVRVGMSPLVGIFILAWIGFTLVFCVLTWLAILLAQPSDAVEGGSMAAVVLLMPLFGVVLLLVGRWMAAGDEGWLLALLRETLDATG